MDVRALFVNLDHLAEAGIDPAAIDTSNWDQLNEFGAQLVQQDGDSYQPLGLRQQAAGAELLALGQG